MGNVLCTFWTSVIDDCSKDGDKDNEKDKDKDGDKEKTKNKDNEDGNDTDDTAELIAVARKRKMAKHSNKKNNVLEENKTLPEEIENIPETKMQDKNNKMMALINRNKLKVKRMKNNSNPFADDDDDDDDDDNDDDAS